MKKSAVVITLLLLSAFLVLYHQYCNWGVWFELADLHHETFAVALAGVAMGIKLGKTL